MIQWGSWSEGSGGNAPSIWEKATESRGLQVLMKKRKDPLLVDRVTIRWLEEV